MSDKPSPYSYRVKSIVKIIDGDTFDCIMDLGFDVLLEARVRMMGIDNEKGKFGRILGWVWCNGVNINNQMIDEHMAVAYHGQSKDDIEQQHLANRTILQEQGKV